MCHRGTASSRAAPSRSMRKRSVPSSRYSHPGAGGPSGDDRALSDKSRDARATAPRSGGGAEQRALTDSQRQAVVDHVPPPCCAELGQLQVRGRFRRSCEGDAYEAGHGWPARASAGNSRRRPGPTENVARALSRRPADRHPARKTRKPFACRGVNVVGSQMTPMDIGPPTAPAHRPAAQGAGPPLRHARHHRGRCASLGRRAVTAILARAARRGTTAR